MAGDPKTIARLNGSAAEARARAKEDRQQRQAAPNILNPNEVHGDYDAGRMLMTTLGGEVRPITADDLAQFRHNARVAGRRFKSGITARQVVDMSLSADRKRARQQITMAVPAGARGTRGSNQEPCRGPDVTAQTELAHIAGTVHVAQCYGQQKNRVVFFLTASRYSATSSSVVRQ